MIECYRFETPFGDVLLTSHHNSVMLDYEEFEPAQITHSAIEISSSLNTVMTNDISVPNEHPLALTYAFGQSPQSLVVTIYEVDEDEETFSVIWTGELQDMSTSNEWTTFNTTSVIQTEVAGNASPVMFQALCNHDLYDERCKVVKADHTISATVTEVQDRFITVDDTVFPDEAFNIGVMVNTASGEARAIITNLSNVVQITYPFVNIEVGDTVELSQGCDHARLGSCKGTFNNTANYGGYDFVPVNNPFETERV